MLPAPLDYDVILRLDPGAVTPACLGIAGTLAFDAWLSRPRDETTLQFRAAA